MHRDGKNLLSHAAIYLVARGLPGIIAFLAMIGLFLSTSPVNAIGLRAVPPELRASAMAAMIFTIHLFGDLWSPAVLGLLIDHLPVVIAMLAVPLTFALSATLWWPRKAEAT
jgi:hypothetical protein